MIKTSLYHFGASLVRNISGEIGTSIRKRFYKLAGVKMGKRVVIGENVLIYRPYNLEIADDVEIGYGVIISAVEKIKLGNEVGIAPYCAIYDNNHKMPKSLGDEGLSVALVEIGDYSWIGTHSVILKGVKIGKNVTVGAGCVVIKNIPDNAVVVGNPSRIIKYNPPREESLVERRRLSKK